MADWLRLKSPKRSPAVMRCALVRFSFALTARVKRWRSPLLYNSAFASGRLKPEEKRRLCSRSQDRQRQRRRQAKWRKLSIFSGVSEREKRRGARHHFIRSGRRD